MPPSKIRTILFDCMDTLVRDPFPGVFEEFFGCDLEALFAQKSGEAWVDFEKGLIDEDAYNRRAFHDGRTFDSEGLKARCIETYEYLPGIEGLLKRLVAQGIPMHVLSNYPIWYQNIEKKLRVSQYMPWTFVSTHLGVRKPSVEIYERCVAHLGMEPASILFVDDRKSNIDAALACGLDGHLFKSSSVLQSFLEQTGVLGSG